MDELTQTHGINEFYPPKDKGNYTIADIRFLTESQECDFIEFLAYLDGTPGHLPPDITIDIKSIIQKLFKNSLLESENQFEKKNAISFESPLFLKNKYLYLFGEGAKNYLRARYSMENEKSELDKLEIETLEQLIKKNCNRLTLISLGSANAIKEINALNNIYSSDSKGEFSFIPIDVSANLIQLAVLYFYYRFKKGEFGNIHPLVGDILDTLGKKEEILSLALSNSKRIFTLLGSTISNYKEKQFLLDIFQLLNENDYLVIGIDTIQSSTDEKEKMRIYDQYTGDQNFSYMQGPLIHIPDFKKYFDEKRRYFKDGIRDAIVTKGVGEQEKKYRRITDVKESICYAPVLLYPTGANGKPVEIYLAQSTKYQKDIFKSFVEENIFIENENGSIRDSLEYLEGESKYSEHSACLIFQKKRTIDKTKLIKDLQETIFSTLERSNRRFEGSETIPLIMDYVKENLNMLNAPENLEKIKTLCSGLTGHVDNDSKILQDIKGIPLLPV